MNNSREINYSDYNQDNITNATNIKNNINSYIENPKLDNINKEENTTNNQSTKKNLEIKFYIHYITTTIFSLL